MKQDRDFHPGHGPFAPYADSAGSRETGASLADTALLFWRAKWLILGVAFLCGVLSLLAAMDMKPVYRASTKVMFDLQERRIVDVEQVLASAGSDTSLQNEIEILTSSVLLSKVVTELSLHDFPDFNPALSDRRYGLPERLTEITQYLVPRSIESRLPDARIVEAEAQPDESRASRERAIGSLRSAMILRPIPNSRVIEISVEASNARQAADIANSIANHYVQDKLDTKLDATRAANEWLSVRVAELQTNVEAAEAAVEEARSATSRSAGQTPELTRQRLLETNSALSLLRTQEAEARARAERLAAALKNGRDLGAIHEFRASREMQLLRARHADLLIEERTYRRSLRQEHPSILRVEAEIGEIEDAIAVEARRIVSASSTEHATKVAQLALLERDLAALDAVADQQARDQVHIRQLVREADANRALYQSFLARLKETTEQEGLQQANARILSSATIPDAPHGQTRHRLAMLGAMLGALAAMAWVYFRSSHDDRLVVPGDLERITDHKVLGAVPCVGSVRRREKVIARFRQNPRSSLAEAIQSIRTSLLVQRDGSAPQVVMFTSSVPREGKSTSAMLVALASRQMGKSTIIVDCDLRLPVLEDLARVDTASAGLLSLLDGRASLNDAIDRDPATGLHMLMAKSGEPSLSVNAADALSSRRFASVLAELRNRYDFVILDTPPVLVVADARILAPKVDAIAYAVLWKSTPAAAVIEGLEELERVGGPRPGTIMTRVQERNASRYSVQGRSYFRGKYGDYFEA